jgi:hypothetical protein
MILAVGGVAAGFPTAVKATTHRNLPNHGTSRAGRVIPFSPTPRKGIVIGEDGYPGQFGLRCDSSKYLIPGNPFRKFNPDIADGKKAVVGPIGLGNDNTMVFSKEKLGTVPEPLHG